MEENNIIAKGFDRDIDYKTMRELLKKELQKQYDKFMSLEPEYKKQNIRAIIYILIVMIQLRNGSRISEAVKAFILFINNPDHNEKVIVKISKSDGMKYNKKADKLIKAKARYRKMMFPSKWFDIDIFTILKDHEY